MKTIAPITVAALVAATQAFAIGSLAPMTVETPCGTFEGVEMSSTLTALPGVRATVIIGGQPWPVAEGLLIDPSVTSGDVIVFIEEAGGNLRIGCVVPRT